MVKKKVLLVSSVGGHLSELMELQPLLIKYDVVLVTNDRTEVPDFPFHRIYRIVHAERDIRVLWNFVEASVILGREQPDIILSAGAGPAVPFALLGKWLTGSKILFVETASAVKAPTLTGRMLYPIADHFFFHWSSMRKHYPKGNLAPFVFGDPS